mgnify:CR=1 FL=1
MARLVRAQFLSLRERSSSRRRARSARQSCARWCATSCPIRWDRVIVAGTVDVAVAIILESTLSFLGLGFPPDIPTWGRICCSTPRITSTSPRIGRLFAGGAIFLAVLSINFIGDGLRDALDPRRVI